MQTGTENQTGVRGVWEKLTLAVPQTPSPGEDALLNFRDALCLEVLQPALAKQLATGVVQLRVAPALLFPLSTVGAALGLRSCASRSPHVPR